MSEGFYEPNLTISTQLTGSSNGFAAFKSAFLAGWKKLVVDGWHVIYRQALADSPLRKKIPNSANES